MAFLSNGMESSMTIGMLCIKSICPFQPSQSGFRDCWIKCWIALKYHLRLGLEIGRVPLCKAILPQLGCLGSWTRIWGIGYHLLCLHMAKDLLCGGYQSTIVHLWLKRRGWYDSSRDIDDYLWTCSCRESQILCGLTACLAMEKLLSVAHSVSL